MTPDARALLDSIMRATGCTIVEGDPQQPLIDELVALGMIKETTFGSDWTAYKVMHKANLAFRAGPRTTDSATPTINPAGSRSGLIPPAVTEDPRVSRTTYTNRKGDQ